MLARDRHTVAAVLHRFLRERPRRRPAQGDWLAETIDAWCPQILAFLITRHTNAGTEGANRMIKDVGQVAFGFRHLESQRRRVRFDCTRQSRRNDGAEGSLPPQL